MDFENSEEIEKEEAGVRISQADLLRSYFAFASRAVKARWPLVALIFIVGASASAGIVALLPVNYHCEMKLTAMRNLVLEDEREGRLGGARELIKQHENLVALVKRADLVRSWKTDRSPVLRTKDQIMARLRGGEPSDADQQSALVYKLDQSLSVDAQDITLTIGVDWPSGPTAARIVEAAEESFLEARHVEEISAIQETISIIDQHASTVRDEIDTIAEQLQRLREEKLAQVDKVLKAGDTPTAASPTQVAAPRRAPRVALLPDETLPSLKEQLEEKKHAITNLETDRGRRLTEARAKLADMRIRYTAAHPAVLAAEQSVNSLSQPADQVASLRAEVLRLESDIKERTASSRGEASSGGGGPGVAPAASAAKVDVLPADVMRLLESGAGVDPTASAHLGGAVSEYTRLRESIRSKQIALDTAQAAFNHRYKILVPADVPSKPTKSKGPVILGGGIIAALVLGLLLAIAGELRTGVIIERWQVHQMEIPVLAELPFPPGSE